MAVACRTVAPEWGAELSFTRRARHHGPTSHWLTRYPPPARHFCSSYSNLEEHGKSAVSLFVAEHLSLASILSSRTWTRHPSDDYQVPARDKSAPGSLARAAAGLETAEEATEGWFLSWARTFGWEQSHNGPGSHAHRLPSPTTMVMKSTTHSDRLFWSRRHRTPPTLLIPAEQGSPGRTLAELVI